MMRYRKESQKRTRRYHREVCDHWTELFTKEVNNYYAKNAYCYVIVKGEYVTFYITDGGNYVSAKKTSYT